MSDVADATYDVIEKFREAYNEVAAKISGAVQLPPAITPVRSEEHAAWCRAGLDQSPDMLRWTELGARLAAKGELAGAINDVRRLILGEKVPRSAPLTDDSIGDLPVSPNAFASLRTEGESPSDLPATTPHGTGEGTGRGRRAPRVDPSRR